MPEEDQDILDESSIDRPIKAYHKSTQQSNKQFR